MKKPEKIEIYEMLSIAVAVAQAKASEDIKKATAAQAKDIAKASLAWKAALKKLKLLAYGEPRKTTTAKGKK